MDPLKVEPESTTIINFSQNIGQSTFKCSKCPETFEFKSQQIIHEMSHKVKTTCQVCSKKIYKGNMKEHMKVHLLKKSYICDFCDEKYATKYLIMFHLRSQHIKSKAYYCDNCGRGFNDSRHYKNHLMRHIDSRPFKCDLCPKEYMRKEILEYHMISAHQTERKLQCTICEFETINLQKLRKHRILHLKMLKCEFCDKEFKERQYLTLHHEIAHVKERNYQCLLCEKKFYAAQYVKRHLKRIHSGQINEFRCLVPKKSPRKVSENRVPDKEIIRKNMIKNLPVKIPKNKSVPKNKVAVEEDKIKISINSSIEQHQIKSENDQIKSENEKLSEIQIKVKEEPDDYSQNIQSYQPDPSNHQIIKEEAPKSKITSYQPRMSFSKIRYMENQIFGCPTCSIIFENRSSLVLHEPKCKMRNKANDNLNCKFCDKKFSDQFTLEVHINVRHVNAKIYKCRECDFETTHHFEYRNHRMTHMELIKCEKCEKKFPNENLMQEHASYVHIGPSEFNCEICFVGFKSSVFLQRHMKTVHSISKFDCKYCEKSFESRDELNQHVGNLWKIKKCSSFIKSESVVEN